MRRLFNAYVQLIYEDKLGEASVNAVIAPPHRVLVERAQARRANAVEEQDLTQRRLF